MSVTRSGPRISRQPLARVPFPAPESPTTHSMRGRPARNGSGVFLLIAGVVRARLEHATGAYVHGVDAREVLSRDHAPLGDEAVRLAQLDAVERGAHAARVGKVGLAHPQYEVFAERVARRPVELVVLAPHHQVCD